MDTRQKLSSIAFGLSAFVGLATSLSLIGREARLVDVITLFATGFGSGAALIVLLRNRAVPVQANQAAPDDTTGEGEA